MAPLLSLYYFGHLYLCAGPQRGYKGHFNNPDLNISFQLPEKTWKKRTKNEKDCFLRKKLLLTNLVDAYFK